MRARALTYALVWLAAALVIVLTWRALWFLTDDAFIEYRYVSNSVAGLGFVWNPPPFRPVEGFTSFSWVVLLDLAWRVFRIEPPRAANLLSLAASLTTLAIVLVFVARANLSKRAATVRLPLAAMVIAGTVANRTFLAWTSSGMETALFAMLMSAWLVTCIGPASHTRGSLTWVSIVAALAALTRPDGLLVVAGSLVLVIAIAKRTRSRRVLIAALPLLAVAAHLAWRRAFYGAWLPNTFYAKQGAPWPSLGLRYLALFVIEYGLLPWLCVIGLAVAKRARPTLSHGVALFVWGGQALYYVLSIGGDSFEFRIFCHWIPFIFVAWILALDRLDASRRVLVGATLAFVIWTLPLQWLHFSLDWPSRLRSDEDPPLRIASHLPPGTRWVGGVFDRLQESLIRDGACLRYADHRDFWLRRVGSLPSRTVGERVSSEGHPTRIGWAVGYLGWVLPNVAILDRYGLNDAVVARTPYHGKRYLAHNRRPPPGYFECFDPNVEVFPDHVEVRPRATPMTAERIRACEADWSTLVRR